MVQFLISNVISLFFQLKQQLNIDNTRYGVLSSCVSIINTIFPIAGGFFIDAFGSAWGTLAVNAFVIIGCLLTAIAANIQSFALMVVGRVIFGIGSGLIVTMQESLLSKWFRTQHLSIAIGLQLSISRLATFLGTIAAGSIVADTNDWVWSFWLSFIICGFSIAMNIVYALVVKRLRGAVVTKRDLMELKSKKSFNWRSVTKFPVHYWHIILIEFIFAAVWSSFQTISTDLVQVHFGTTQVLAAYTASASLVVPIIATPLLGIFMDYFGSRVFICKYLAVFALFLFSF
jgi:MFS family permease